MPQASDAPLLGENDPPPFRILEEGATSPFLVICDHAGNVLPKSLSNLGLGDADLKRHIAWDIGVAGVAERLAPLLSAFTILQTYSRLVIDCNRPLGVESSIVQESEYTRIPGNLQVSPAAARSRADAVFYPYHRRIERELERREGMALETVLVALHSFTPVFKGVARPWHAGVLYHRDTRYAHACRDVLLSEGGLTIGDNQPYFVSELSDYGVLEYGERRGRLHVELEIRQDLIEDAEGQRCWAERLARILPAALRNVAKTSAPVPA